MNLFVWDLLADNENPHTYNRTIHALKQSKQLQITLRLERMSYLISIKALGPSASRKILSENNPNAVGKSGNADPSTTLTPIPRPGNDCVITRFFSVACFLSGTGLPSSWARSESTEVEFIVYLTCYHELQKTGLLFCWYLATWPQGPSLLAVRFFFELFHTFKRIMQYHHLSRY